MAIPTSCQRLVAAPLTSVQPGGGFCMRLELAWGRLRRASLRAFFPGYVRRMQALRQGDCSRGFDVIDSRDLKYIRNVCGWWFRPEDDRFAWRGRLRLARYGLAELIVFSAVLGGLLLSVAHLAYWHHPAFWAPAAIVLLLWVFVISFFRDPARSIPTDPALLLSPADGVVTHIGEIEDAEFPAGRAFRVSIFLSVFDVHINRLPRSGRVSQLSYYPGGFLDARHPECGVRNEQLWIDLEEESGRRVRVKQIAGAIARRIVCWLRPDESVRTGERFGMIKFGSRTDVLVPADAVQAVLVQVGSRVHGGTTALARLKS
jgi:phosphatidylserine decarboxylase